MNVTDLFEITSVRPAVEGKSYLATVSFAYQPSGLHPIRIKRSVQKEHGWDEYTDAEIEGPRAVRVRAGFLRRSAKGELYVNASPLELPWDLARRIGEAAASRLQPEVSFDGE